jgi:acyl-CoA thioesterase FadM
MDDELEIRTYLYDPRRVMVKRHYEMRRVDDETLLARALVLWVCIHLESGQPMRMPADFAADFAPNLAPSISPNLSG